MKDLVLRTHEDTPKFMFHKTQREKIEACKGAIAKQMTHLANSRTAPIQGIHPVNFQGLRNHTIQVQGARDALQHESSETEGRCSVMTNVKNFNQVTKYLRKNLTMICDDCEVSSAHDADLPQISLAFQHSPDDDSQSEGSFRSHHSACSVAFADADDVADCSHEPTGPATQAWKTATVPASVSRSVPIPDALSTMTEFNRMERENDQCKFDNQALQNQVEELSLKVVSMDKQIQLPRSSPSFHISFAPETIQEVAKAAAAINARKPTQDMEAS